MIQTRPGSRMDVWKAKYIFNQDCRSNDDKDVTIVQIAPGSCEGEYMVEVIDSDEEY